QRQALGASSDRPARCLAFSPDGRMLAVGGDDHKVRLYDLATGAQIRQFTGHDNEVHSLAFSADGKVLASGSFDTTALVWNVPDLLPHRPGRATVPTGELDVLWRDLGDADAAKAYRAIWSLTAVPRQGVRLLQTRLRPTPGVEV